ncbi:MAG: hypothetical protein QOF58_1402, partial [Pseudonocardiales bacterium]|nr:hypothetical protein [Pseudonocardiales bacterium]
TPGEPVLDGVHATPANLSSPARPNTAETSFWSSASTFTQNEPLSAIAAQLREVRCGQNSTKGGSSDNAAKDWQANPTGPSADMPVTTVTPVQK